MAELTDLPRWDLSTVYPALDSAELRRDLQRARDEIAALAALFDEHSVGRLQEQSASPEQVALYESVTARLNALYELTGTLYSYVGCHVAADAADEAAQTLYSELQVAGIPLRQLGTRYTAWTGTLDVEALLAASSTARDHEHALRQARVYAARQMPQGEEELAAELAPPGISGWVRLHSDVSALLSVPLALRGEEKALPMSAVRALANDPDREVRRAAYEAELAAWERVSVPLAAALNGVKGYQGALRRRRGWSDDIEPTLPDNGIDRGTLKAMQAACAESFPDFRRYMHAKARCLGLDRLAWYDVNAPVGQSSRSYSWTEAEDYIREQFAVYSERMAGLADRSFRERWIDVGPRPGKEGGAFCSPIRPGESRILMNYDGSFNSVSTLAHELGHAYHNLNLEFRKPLQSDTPATLAETASIFCETIIFEAAYAHSTPAERLTLVEGSLQRDLLVVVDIYSRFLFEKAVFERRGERDLTVREFNTLMLDAQAQTYGDGLDESLRHPYMWAVKGHYYGPTFYNYPYTFGLLFGLGLYRRYRQEPDAFRAGYDDLLSSTGMADAATLGQRFGIDVRSVDFWRSSLDLIRGRIDEFVRLAGE